VARVQYAPRVGVLGAIGTALWVVTAVVVLVFRHNTLRMAGKFQLCLSAGTLALAFLPVDHWVLRLRAGRSAGLTLACGRLSSAHTASSVKC